jgi:glycosyltransferase involved in cell wall biosynthesis
MTIEQSQGLVHVFISSYNRGFYLTQAVESVLAQTYQNLHIIIVDDASTTGAGDIAELYANEYPGKVTAICKPNNLGVCDSVNKALSFCKKGEYFAFFADDDIWLPEKLEQQMRLLSANPNAGMVWSEAMIIDEMGEYKGKSFSELYDKGTRTFENMTRKLFLQGNFICAASVVVTYEALELFDFKLPENVGSTIDWFMWLVISSHFDVLYIAEPLLYYRVSCGSLSNNPANRKKLISEAQHLLTVAYINYTSISCQISESEYADSISNFKSQEPADDDLLKLAAIIGEQAKFNISLSKTITEKEKIIESLANERESLNSVVAKYKELLPNLLKALSALHEDHLSIESELALAHLCLTTNLDQSAIRFFSKAIENAPDNNEALLQLANLHYRLGNAGLARDYLELVFHNDFHHPEARQLAATIVET